VETRRQKNPKAMRAEAAKLLRAVFMRGAIARGKAADILNMSERNARRTVSALLGEGLLRSSSHRAPLTIGLPLTVLPFYFPDLYDPSLVGAEVLSGQGPPVRTP
jgi:hypothetical protein